MPDLGDYTTISIAGAVVLVVLIIILVVLRSPSGMGGSPRHAPGYQRIL